MQASEALVMHQTLTAESKAKTPTSTVSHIDHQILSSDGHHATLLKPMAVISSREPVQGMQTGPPRVLATV
jgi:hypothetical protein